MTIRTVFAPSPTGYLHVGGAQTALFCCLFARRHRRALHPAHRGHGPGASAAESVKAILEGMEWLGLEYDKGPFYQTDSFRSLRPGHHERLPKDRPIVGLQQGAAGQHARRADGGQLKPRYDGLSVSRPGPDSGGDRTGHPFPQPDKGQVVFEDLVRGPISTPITGNWTTSSSAAARLPHLQLHRGGRRHGYGRSPTSSAVTTTSITHPARSISCAPSARNRPISPTCP